VANLVAKNEMLARLYTLAGNKDKAIDHFEELLQLNSSNSRYYYEILKIRGIEKKTSYSEEEEAKIQEILGEYEKNLPKATAHQRIALALLSGERFKNKLASYAKPLISKGAPAFL
jgi:hypothetical protein